MARTRRSESSRSARSASPRSTRKARGARRRARRGGRARWRARRRSCARRRARGREANAALAARARAAAAAGLERAGAAAGGGGRGGDGGAGGGGLRRRARRRARRHPRRRPRCESHRRARPVAVDEKPDYSRRPWCSHFCDLQAHQLASPATPPVKPKLPDAALVALAGSAAHCAGDKGKSAREPPPRSEALASRASAAAAEAVSAADRADVEREARELDVMDEADAAEAGAESDYDGVAAAMAPRWPPAPRAIPMAATAARFAQLCRDAGGSIALSQVKAHYEHRFGEWVTFPKSKGLKGFIAQLPAGVVEVRGAANAERLALYGAGAAAASAAAAGVPATEAELLAEVRVEPRGVQPGASVHNRLSHIEHDTKRILHLLGSEREPGTGAGAGPISTAASRARDGDALLGRRLHTMDAEATASVDAPIRGGGPHVADGDFVVVLYARGGRRGAAGTSPYSRATESNFVETAGNPLTSKDGRGCGPPTVEMGSIPETICRRQRRCRGTARASTADGDDGDDGDDGEADGADGASAAADDDSPRAWTTSPARRKTAPRGRTLLPQSPTTRSSCSTRPARTASARARADGEDSAVTLRARRDPLRRGGARGVDRVPAASGVVRGRGDRARAREQGDRARDAPLLPGEHRLATVRPGRDLARGPRRARVVRGVRPGESEIPLRVLRQVGQRGDHGAQLAGG